MLRSAAKVERATSSPCRSLAHTIHLTGYSRSTTPHSGKSHSRRRRCEGKVYLALIAWSCLLPPTLHLPFLSLDRPLVFSLLNMSFHPSCRVHPACFSCLIVFFGLPDRSGGKAKLVNGVSSFNRAPHEGSLLRSSRGRDWHCYFRSVRSQTASAWASQLVVSTTLATPL